MEIGGLDALEILALDGNAITGGAVHVDSP
jgi:hypothetical protein